MFADNDDSLVLTHGLADCLLVRACLGSPLTERGTHSSQNYSFTSWPPNRRLCRGKEAIVERRLQLSGLISSWPQALTRSGAH
jgi:hypothetical protein